MTKNEINSKIRMCNSNISYFRSKVNSCESEIREVERLASKLEKTRTVFISANDARWSRVSELQSTPSGISVPPKYFSGMKSVVRGNDYNRALNNLQNAIRVVASGKSALIRQAGEYDGKIAYYRRLKAHYAEELKNAED